MFQGTGGGARYCKMQTCMIIQELSRLMGVIFRWFARFLKDHLHSGRFGTLSAFNACSVQGMALVILSMASRDFITIVSTLPLCLWVKLEVGLKGWMFLVDKGEFPLCISFLVHLQLGKVWHLVSGLISGNLGKLLISPATSPSSLSLQLQFDRQHLNVFHVRCNLSLGSSFGLLVCFSSLLSRPL